MSWKLKIGKEITYKNNCSTWGVGGDARSRNENYFYPKNSRAKKAFLWNKKKIIRDHDQDTFEYNWKPSGTNVINIFAEYHYAECHSDECCYAVIAEKWQLYELRVMKLLHKFLYIFSGVINICGVSRLSIKIRN